jgi:hypothetical protein
MDGRFVLTVDSKGKMAIWEVQKKREKEKNEDMGMEKEEINDSDKTTKITPLSSLFTNKGIINFKAEDAIGVLLFIFYNIKNYYKT